MFSAMPFLVGVDAENIYKALQLRDDVSPFHSQLQGVILQFVEVHQLVHQTEHAPHTALYDVKQLFVSPSILGLSQSCVTGPEIMVSGDAELVRDVGKETHVHAVHPLFLLLLKFGYAGWFLFPA